MSALLVENRYSRRRLLVPEAEEAPFPRAEESESRRPPLRRDENHCDHGRGEDRRGYDTNACGAAHATLESDSRSRY